MFKVYMIYEGRDIYLAEFDDFATAEDFTMQFDSEIEVYIEEEDEGG